MHDRSVSRSRAFWALCLLGAIVAVPTPVHAGLGFDSGHVDLGKVAPGHTSRHTWQVTNTGTTDVEVVVQASCGCADYLTITPERFTLRAGGVQPVEAKVAVPLDADPGIHDNKVVFVERSAEGSDGGSAQSAVARNLQFQVESAKVFIDGPRDDGTFGARFVNAHPQAIDVEVSARLLQGDGSAAADGRDLPSAAFTAPGSEKGSAVTRFDVALGLGADDRGTYTLLLDATWADPKTGQRVQQDTIRHTFTHGELVEPSAFEIELRPTSVGFRATITNLGETVRPAWLEVDLREAGRPDIITLKSETKHIAAGSSSPFEIVWDGATGESYTATAYAVTSGADGAGGALRSASGPAEGFDLPAGMHRSPEAAALANGGTDSRSADASGAGAGLGLGGTVGLVAGIAIGAAVGGGLVAFVIVRRTRP